MWWWSVTALGLAGAFMLGLWVGVLIGLVKSSEGPRTHEHH